MKIILPPNYREFDEPLIFLAGPIKGAPRWQNEAIKILEKLSSEIVIASPSWRIDEKYFGDNKNWEVFGVLGNAEHFRHDKLRKQYCSGGGELTKTGFWKFVNQNRRK